MGLIGLLKGRKMKKFRMWIIRLLCGGKLPIDAVSALWILIDEENQKPEDEIRCDYIEAWEEASERVKSWI